MNLLRLIQIKRNSKILSLVLFKKFPPLVNMEEFLSSWQPDKPTKVHEFITQYFKWCDEHNQQRKKIDVKKIEDILKPYGYIVDESRYIIFGK